MVDVHSHILPSFDDGAQDTDIAFEMLKASVESGVDTVISTSHFYPKGEISLEKFLQRRKARLSHLKNEAEREGYKIPRIIKGAEVNLAMDVSEYRLIKNLCIENTEYILVELPYGIWGEAIVDYIYSLIVKGFKPVIAHVERYRKVKTLFNDLKGLELIYQVNADIFMTARGRLLAVDLIRNGHAHIIGSDMHNMSVRTPNLSKGYELLEKYFGKEYVEFFAGNAEKLINNQKIDKYGAKSLEKVSKLSVIF